MSDSYVDLSTKLEMTMSRIASNYSGGLIHFFLYEVGLFIRFIFYSNISSPIVISTGAVAEWRNLFFALCGCKTIVFVVI